MGISSRSTEGTGNILMYCMSEYVEIKLRSGWWYRQRNQPAENCSGPTRYIEWISLIVLIPVMLLTITKIMSKAGRHVSVSEENSDSGETRERYNYHWHYTSLTAMGKNETFK